MHKTWIITSLTGIKTFTADIFPLKVHNRANNNKLLVFPLFFEPFPSTIAQYLNTYLKYKNARNYKVAAAVFSGSIFYWLYCMHSLNNTVSSTFSEKNTSLYAVEHIKRNKLSFLLVDGASICRFET